MKCPRCNSSDSKTLETRKLGNNTFSRRRECLACEHRWRTHEVINYHETLDELYKLRNIVSQIRSTMEIK